MKITILPHAKERMQERGITEYIVHDYLLHPDQIEIDKHNPARFAAKKLYKKNNKRLLLIIIYEMEVDEIKIITVISTSKINKYY